MEKASSLIEFKTVVWPNFTFAARDSMMPILDEGWSLLTEPFPLVYINIPVHRMGDPVPQFIQQAETWCCSFYRWKPGIIDENP